MFDDDHDAAEAGLFLDVREAVEAVLRTRGIDSQDAFAAASITARECESWLTRVSSESKTECDGEDPFR